mgnify:FL=1
MGPLKAVTNDDFSLFCLFKHVFCDAAKRAGEVIGNVFPLGSGRDAFFGIALFLVVFPAANRANVFHDFTSEMEFLPNFILCRLREVMPRKRINYIISTFGILSIVFGKIFRKNFRYSFSV